MRTIGGHGGRLYVYIYIFVNHILTTKNDHKVKEKNSHTQLSYNPQRFYENPCFYISSINDLIIDGIFMAGSTPPECYNHILWYVQKVAQITQISRLGYRNILFFLYIIFMDVVFT